MCAPLVHCCWPSHELPTSMVGCKVGHSCMPCRIGRSMHTMAGLSLQFPQRVMITTTTGNCAYHAWHTFMQHRPQCVVFKALPFEVYSFCLLLVLASRPPCAMHRFSRLWFPPCLVCQSLAPFLRAKSRCCIITACFFGVGVVLLPLHRL